MSASEKKTNRFPEGGERDNHAPLWSGRFCESPDADAVAFETSIGADARMAQDDIAGSMAHAGMLGKQGIIPAEDASRIVQALEGIAADLRSGALQIDPAAEDIHSFVEAVLTDRIGDAGRRLHTGRSRNDQIALDERLYLRRALRDLQKELVSTVEALVSVAEQHTGTLLPGYTHMQRAQPVTLAHHLCAWCWPLTRDYGRIGDALARMDAMPLGSGALAGSGLPLDRQQVAGTLGFSRITPNSLDAVSDRDYVLESAAAFAILMTHLSRFCEEIVLWSTEEFGFIRLPEKWSTGSSIMPQKKNPDFAELIRGRCGRVTGDLVALLTMMKGLPLSYNRDLQEDKNSLFSAYDTALSCLRVFRSMVSAAEWDTGRMRAACTGGHANATDLADYLVRKGMPFRTAHTVAASVVRECIESGVQDMTELPFVRLAAHAEEIGQDVYSFLTPEACVSARSLPGGPAPQAVAAQLEELRRFCRNSV